MTARAQTSDPVQGARTPQEQPGGKPGVAGGGGAAGHAGPQSGAARAEDARSDPAARAEGERRVAAARVWVARHRPYYTKALFSCPLVFTDAVETMAIDPQWRIYANPAFAASLSVEEAAAALLHELNHGLRSHKERAERLPVPDGARQIWNIAGDCEINDDLAEDGLSPREEWMYPHRFEMRSGGLAEGYYQHLLDNAEVVTTGIWCCGSGAGGAPADCETSDAGQGPDGSGFGVGGLSPAQREVLRRATAQAIDDHHQQNGWGSVPSGLRRWANKKLRPEVDWRRVLAAEVRRGLHRRPGVGDYTWAPPAPSPRRRHGDPPRLRPPVRGDRGGDRHLRVHGRTRPGPRPRRDAGHPHKSSPRRSHTGLQRRRRRRLRPNRVQPPARSNWPAAEEPTWAPASKPPPENTRPRSSSSPTDTPPGPRHAPPPTPRPSSPFSPNPGPPSESPRGSRPSRSAPSRTNGHDQAPARTDEENRWPLLWGSGRLRR